jgi:hypothetical protein
MSGFRVGVFRHAAYIWDTISAASAMGHALPLSFATFAAGLTLKAAPPCGQNGESYRPIVQNA